MAADSNTRLALLPSEDLPSGYPKPVVSETEHLEVYGLAEQRAAFILEKSIYGQATVRIRGLWLSSQDSVLARELLAGIRGRHTFPGKQTVLRISGGQTGVLSELEVRGIPFIAQIMTKRVDERAGTPLPEGITYSGMDENELEGFLARVKNALAEQEASNEDRAIPWETAKDRAHESMCHLLPKGGATPGHTFVVISSQGDNDPVKVGYLWTYMDKEKQRSFCYDIEIVESLRGKGLGRKAVAVWEHIATEQRAATLALNIFKNNDVALKLYKGTGFIVDSAVFVLNHDDEVG